MTTQAKLRCVGGRGAGHREVRDVDPRHAATCLGPDKPQLRHTSPRSEVEMSRRAPTSAPPTSEMKARFGQNLDRCCEEARSPRKS